MSFHRGNQSGGAVAVSSYSSGSSIVAHTPGRRYSSGTSNVSSAAASSGSSSTSYNAYRSAAASSILDRPTSSYYSFSTSNNSRNSISSESYRRSYCSPSLGSSYSIPSGANNYRCNFRLDYGRSPASRTVSSTTYRESASNITSNPNSASTRYGSSTSPSSSSSSSSPSSTSSSASLARYSPSSYTPNIHQRRKSPERLNDSSSNDEYHHADRRDRTNSSCSTLSTSNSSNSFWPRTKRRGTTTTGIDTEGGGGSGSIDAERKEVSSTTATTPSAARTDALRNIVSHRVSAASDHEDHDDDNDRNADVNDTSDLGGDDDEDDDEEEQEESENLKEDENNDDDRDENGDDNDSESHRHHRHDHRVRTTSSPVGIGARANNEADLILKWAESKCRLNEMIDMGEDRIHNKHYQQHWQQQTDENNESLDSTYEGTFTNILLNGITEKSALMHGDENSISSKSSSNDAEISETGSFGHLASSSTRHQTHYRLNIDEQLEAGSSEHGRGGRSRCLQIQRSERCGLNGLRNIGNTCFMNSVIQCLSNTRPLLEYLLNDQYTADINVTTSSMKGALIKAFGEVIHELWEAGSDHVVNTIALKSQIQRFTPRFMGYNQQDAQEFLRYLLEGLHEDVNRVTVKPQPILTDIPDTYTDSQKASESWKRYLRNEDSMIVDVFVGQLRSSLRCTSCDHVSVTLDPFWDLSLPIPSRSGNVKLSQCLEHFTREEVLDGDEKPTCSKCQLRRKCTKSFSIQKFPKILVIHLKRFSPMERFRGKLNVLVDFPLTGLDLSAFAAPRVPGCTYNLYGVANHSGTTYSGHYTAYCKHPFSGDWHEYNDSRVSIVPGRSVVSSEAYVLFYEQQPHSSHL
ncbi:ubiquitin carboxyl-terminal hydrolase 4-like isoform X5 [Prorops nasuta]|uniref:ubiquitin carboxyl-terminal hydrolase 4-like isoform X5 n=1 Tax=Prorops nasuta TaxID=863751 RepID=UPI0034CEDCAB